MRNKTRILVTHAIDFIHMADHIIIMDKGTIKHQGTFDELKKTETLSKLLEINKINVKDLKLKGKNTKKVGN